MFRFLSGYLAPENLFTPGYVPRPPQTIKVVVHTAHAGEPRPCLVGGQVRCQVRIGGFDYYYYYYYYYITPLTGVETTRETSALTFKI